MPIKSKAQLKFLMATKPAVAKKLKKNGGKGQDTSKLPEHLKAAVRRKIQKNGQKNGNN